MDGYRNNWMEEMKKMGGRIKKMDLQRSRRVKKKQKKKNHKNRCSIVAVIELQIYGATSNTQTNDQPRDTYISIYSTIVAE